MKRTYDQKVVAREFKEGNEVLVLSPVKGQPFNAKYQGPYMIEKRVNMVNYIISTPECQCKTQLCHINRLKGYVKRAEDRPVMAVQETTPNDGKGYMEGEIWTGKDPPVRLDNSVVLNNPEDKQG